MRIGIGCDHRGYDVKRRVVPMLQRAGHEVVDLGANSEASSDYPDFAFEVAQAVSSGRLDRGILICGTGIGMCIAANKVPGIRAAMAQDELSAQLSRTHNDANILCLSADLIGQTLAKRVVDIFTKTAFEGGRHQRRLDKIAAIERGQDPSSVRTS